jgi:DNA repair exonuclease SbcCD ATPase subunit
MTPKGLLWRFYRRPRAALSVSLRDVTGKLQDLARSTEADFLEVGSRLDRIMSHARAEAQTITDMLETSRERRQPVLTRALDEVRAWTGHAERAAGSEPLFAALEPVVEAASQPLEALQDTVRVLRLLGFATRIESAWLGDQAGNFQTLAAEVRSLADGIEEKSASLAEARQAMSRLLDRARHTAAHQERIQRNEMLRLTTECAAGLEELHQEQERITGLSAGARSDYQKVAAGVGEIVMNLQSHDSVRQRLEHIVESLKHVRQGLIGQDIPMEAGAAARNVELQVVQLREARADFLTAIGGIRQELDRIGGVATDYPRMVRELTGRSRETDHFAAISATMAELGESRAALSAAAEEVRLACARMIGFVTDIETLGERLMRLGLNAEVQAVQLSGCGAVMEAVASNIRMVAQNASENARAAGVALRELGAPAARLKEALGKDSDSPVRDPHEMAARLSRMAGELAATDEENRKMLASVAGGAEAVAREIAALRDGITADEMADRMASLCLVALDGIAAELRGRAGRMPEGLAAQELERAAAIYTMHTERGVLESFAGAGVAAAPEPLVQAPGFDASEIAASEIVDASGFGDNVELF